VKDDKQRHDDFKYAIHEAKDECYIVFELNFSYSDLSEFKTETYFGTERDIRFVLTKGTSFNLDEKLHFINFKILKITSDYEDAVRNGKQISSIEDFAR